MNNEWTESLALAGSLLIAIGATGLWGVGGGMIASGVVIIATGFCRRANAE